MQDVREAARRIDVVRHGCLAAGLLRMEDADRTGRDGRVWRQGCAVKELLEAALVEPTCPTRLAKIIDGLHYIAAGRDSQPAVVEMYAMACAHGDGEVGTGNREGGDGPGIGLYVDYLERVEVQLDKIWQVTSCQLRCEAVACFFVVIGPTALHGKISPVPGAVHTDAFLDAGIDPP